ncbi:hypothetical protein GF357_03255 [Candidatus Dojkabacteria bacterium]|nr:hypothetical protein [Candidatus Dojkabacteria bacterium]
MKPVFAEKTTYKGKDYKSELYIKNDYSEISPITQAHAVCFIDKNTLLFQQFRDGTLGNLGGGIRPSENIEQALRRELIEEGQCELLSWKTFGYERISKLSQPGLYEYFLRTAAHVKLLDKSVKDPCGKSIGRAIVPYCIAAHKLGWGKKGRLLLKYARKKYLEYI